MVELGTWANVTRISRGRDETALDFLRHLLDEPVPVLVARVLVPPLLVVELRDQLDETWQAYTRWNMPGSPDG